jgi:tetratricopeptide (TPR) repeat protein
LASDETLHMSAHLAVFVLRLSVVVLVSHVTAGCAGSTPLPPKAIEMNELGAIALQEGNLEAAGARLNLALEYNPEFVEAVTNLGLVELQRGNLTRARQLLSRAKRLNPDLAEPHHGLGVLAERGYRPDLAREHYQDALAVDPGFVPARSNLAGLFLEGGLYEDALVQFQRLYELAPESVLGHRGVAESLIALQRFDEALAVVEAALARFPGDPSLCISLARLSLQAGDTPQALEILSPIARFEDDHGAEARAWSAVAFLTAGQTENAVGAAQSALRLIPNHPLASYALAIGLDTLAAPEAKKWLDQALRLNPNNREISERLVKVESR